MSNYTHRIIGEHWGSTFLVDEKFPNIAVSEVDRKAYPATFSWLEQYKNSTSVKIEEIVRIEANE